MQPVNSFLNAVKKLALKTPVGKKIQTRLHNEVLLERLESRRQNWEKASTSQNEARSYAYGLWECYDAKLVTKEQVENITTEVIEAGHTAGAAFCQSFASRCTDKKEKMSFYMLYHKNSFEAVKDERTPRSIIAAECYGMALEEAVQAGAISSAYGYRMLSKMAEEDLEYGAAGYKGALTAVGGRNFEIQKSRKPSSVMSADDHRKMIERKKHYEKQRQPLLKKWDKLSEVIDKGGYADLIQMNRGVFNVDKEAMAQRKERLEQVNGMDN